MTRPPTKANGRICEPVPIGALLDDILRMLEEPPRPDGREDRRKQIQEAEIAVYERFVRAMQKGGGR